MQSRYVYLLVGVCLIVMIFRASALSQTLAIYSGNVVDPQNQPIENAIVSAEGAISDSTNADGEFRLEFTSLRDTTGNIQRISFSHPLFETLVLGVAIAAGDTISGQIITLSPTLQTFTVSGTVTTPEGAPLQDVQNVIVEFTDVTALDSSFFVVVDANGSYQTEATAGMYYVRARAIFRSDRAFSFVSKWYDDVEDFAEASILNVDTDLQLNFTIEQPLLGSISGKVIELATSEPIAEAFILLNSSVPVDSSESLTDADGNYTVDVFEGTYFIWAQKPGFVRLFYDNVQTLPEATPLVVSEENLNITGIDFALFTPEGTNSISGVIMDEATGSPIPNAELVAMPSADISYSARTDANGVYMLDNLPDGTYYVGAHHDDYVSKFYGTTAQRWEDATPIALADHMIAANIDFHLKPLQTYGGQVAGSVASGGATVAGTLISLFNQQDELISGTLSLHDGGFRLTGLADGEYRLEASKVGFRSTSLPDNLTINLTAAPVVRGIAVNLDAVTSVGPDIDGSVPRQFHLRQNYPNPFNPSTTILYEVPEAVRVTITIYDLLGREVRTLIDQDQLAGIHEVKWDGRDSNEQSVSSGVYYYQIRAGEFIGTRKLLLVR